MATQRQRHVLTAIIYDRRGRVLSIGKNSYIKTHPLQAKIARKVGQKDKIFLHAEIHAITRCANLEKAYRMVITRYNKQGKQRLAKPCEVCQEAIMTMTPIKRIDYTVDED